MPRAVARSYLAANCAFCHVPSGGGNSAIDFDFMTKTAGTHSIDVPPIHESFGLPDARIIAPGAPERSVLLNRLARLGTGQMPPLASSRADEKAIALLREWIVKMPPK